MGVLQGFAWGVNFFWFTLYSAPGHPGAPGAPGPPGAPGARCLRAQKVTFEEFVSKNYRKFFLYMYRVSHET